MVQAAKSEAEQILSETRNRAQKLTADARSEAQLAAQKILATALEKAEQEKQKRLASSAIEIEKRIVLNAAEREQAVKAVVRCVCG
ncbi:MAG TPA: hypothetical protein VL863_11605 [bacterium]|nr:hypothetical protein [bacterium]